MENEPETTDDVIAVQEAWHILFEDDYVPSDEAAQDMIDFMGDPDRVIDAIRICSESKKVARKAFEQRLSYTYGIMRNIRNDRLRKPWDGEK